MFLGSIARPARKADDLTAICEPIVLTMWNLQHLRTQYASTPGYEDSFICFFFARQYVSICYLSLDR
jgi:hypothetical protein